MEGPKRTLAYLCPKCKQSVVVERSVLRKGQGLLMKKGMGTAANVVIALLCLLQEAATQAAGQLHLSGPAIRDRYGAFWMLARIRYELKRPLLWDEPVTVKTWHRGGKAAVMYREFDLWVKGEKVGQALSAWVLAGMESHKLPAHQI